MVVHPQHAAAQMAVGSARRLPELLRLLVAPFVSPIDLGQPGREGPLFGRLGLDGLVCDGDRSDVAEHIHEVKKEIGQSCNSKSLLCQKVVKPEELEESAHRRNEKHHVEIREVDSRVVSLSTLLESLHMQLNQHRLHFCEVRIKCAENLLYKTPFFISNLKGLRQLQLRFSPSSSLLFEGLSQNSLVQVQTQKQWSELMVFLRGTIALQVQRGPGVEVISVQEFCRREGLYSQEMVEQELRLLQTQDQINSYFKAQEEIQPDIHVLYKILKNRCLKIISVYKRTNDTLQNLRNLNTRREHLADVTDHQLSSLQQEMLQGLKRISEQRKDRQLCAICKCVKWQYCLVPCGHARLCSDCAKHLDRKCPFCKAIFTSFIKIFRD